DQLWSVEVAGTRVAEPWEKLYRDEAGHWRLMTQPRKDALGEPVTPAVWVQNKEDPEVEVNFTILQVSLFFSIYVFFQVWNQISCRSLTPQTSGFHRIWQNPTFLAIAGTVEVGQIAIVTLCRRRFNDAPLGCLACWVGGDR